MREHRRNPRGHHRALVAEKLVRGPRLPAAERRDAIVATATRVFAERGFGRATTAEIAAEAGISEPILYRHFMSKVELFLACLESAWADMSERWTAAIEAETDGARLLEAVLDAQRDLRSRKPYLSVLLVQALGDSGQDPAINAYMQKHVRRVHDLMTRVLAAAQEAGAIPPERDPAAEAWTHMGISFVSMLAGRLGVMTDAEVDCVTVQRRHWLTGR